MVKFYSVFREIAKVDQMNLEGANDVDALLNLLVTRFGQMISEQLFDSKTSKLRNSVVILVNGHSIKLGQGLKTKLSTGDAVTADTVAIFEAVGGG